MSGAPVIQTAAFPTQLLALPAGSYTTGATLTFDTTSIQFAALDIALTSFTGGTAPTATFTLQRQSANGDWFTVWTSGSTNSATTWSIDLGPNLTQQTTGNANAPDAAIHAVFTAQARFTYAFTGSPTSVQFSASMIGR